MSRTRGAGLWVLWVLGSACSGDGPHPMDAAVDGGGMAGDAAPDGDAQSTDGGPVVPRLPPCEETEPADAMSLTPVASTLEATIEPTLPRVQTPDHDVDPSTEDGEMSYLERGFGRWRSGEGFARVQRADLGGATELGDRRSLVWFAHLADFQLSDDESPLRFAAGDAPGSETAGALRPQEAYLPRAISAMSRTLARIARAERPYDFGIVTGDCADGAQLNELRWVIDVMDGVPGLHTDSGDDDDPLPGPDNDPKDDFDPVPFPAPWLYVPGNHDTEIVGVFSITDSHRRQAMGGQATFGTRDYRQWYAPVHVGRVPAGERRRPLERAEIVAELHDSPPVPGPVGHGYPAEPDLTHGANYAYDIVPGLLRVLVLDSNDTTGGSRGLVWQSTVDGWLVPELERSGEDGVLVMLASHHSTRSMDRRESESGAEQPDAIEPAQLETLVASYPHVIAWLVGHSHDNRIRPVAGADAAHPGYWEIMVSALADWPSQARLVEIVDNGNDTLSIFATLVDFDAESCMERRFRRLALIDYQAAWSDDVSRAPEHSNVELIVPTPASAAAAIATAAASAPTRIESETTLRGMH